MEVGSWSLERPERSGASLSVLHESGPPLYPMGIHRIPTWHASSELQREAPIHPNRGARDVGSIFRDQKRYSLRYLFRLSQSTHR